MLAAMKLNKNHRQASRDAVLLEPSATKLAIIP